MAKKKDLPETEIIPKANETTFPIQKFIDNAKSLGYEKYVVVGALSNCNKLELTKEEFKNIVEKFLGKKVD